MEQDGPMEQGGVAPQRADVRRKHGPPARPRSGGVGDPGFRSSRPPIDHYVMHSGQLVPFGGRRCGTNRRKTTCVRRTSPKSPSAGLRRVASMTEIRDSFSTHSEEPSFMVPSSPHMDTSMGPPPPPVPFHRYNTCPVLSAPPTSTTTPNLPNATGSTQVKPSDSWITRRGRKPPPCVSPPTSPLGSGLLLSPGSGSHTKVRFSPPSSPYDRPKTAHQLRTAPLDSPTSPRERGRFSSFQLHSDNFVFVPQEHTLARLGIAQQPQQQPQQQQQQQQQQQPQQPQQQQQSTPLSPECPPDIHSPPPFYYHRHVTALSAPTSPVSRHESTTQWEFRWAGPTSAQPHELQPQRAVFVSKTHPEEASPCMERGDDEAATMDAVNLLLTSAGVTEDVTAHLCAQLDATFDTSRPSSNNSHEESDSVLSLDPLFTGQEEEFLNLLNMNFHDGGPLGEPEFPG